MDIKEIFDESESITYEEFVKRAKEHEAKFVDLSEGKYVSKQRYDNDLETKKKEISTLNETLNARDKDLADLNTKLTAAGNDTEKLSALSNDFSNLQTKYEQDTKALQDRLNEQKYVFAVKEFANTQKFSSHAARRDFERSMIDKRLTMENDSILGADDFYKKYSAENEDAFVKEEEPVQQKKPMFTKPINDTNNMDETKGFASAFNFIGVRPKE